MYARARLEVGHHGAGAIGVGIGLRQLLADDAERNALGKRAAETMRSQIGATARTAGELEELLARP